MCLQVSLSLSSLTKKGVGSGSVQRSESRFGIFFYIPTYFSTVVTVTATAEAAMRVTATATAGEERVTVTAMTRVTTVTATGDTATARKLAVVRSCRYSLLFLFFFLFLGAFSGDETRYYFFYSVVTRYYLYHRCVSRIINYRYLQ
jgi:hypothetical protein